MLRSLVPIHSQTEAGGEAEDLASRAHRGRVGQGSEPGPLWATRCRSSQLCPRLVPLPPGGFCSLFCLSGPIQFLKPDFDLTLSHLGTCYFFELVQYGSLCRFWAASSLFVDQGLQLRDSVCARAPGLRKPPPQTLWAGMAHPPRAQGQLLCQVGLGVGGGVGERPGLQRLLLSTYSCFCLALPSFPGSPDTSLPQPVTSEGKGAKRKPSEEEENGSEELVEKKVCKGFQTV